MQGPWEGRVWRSGLAWPRAVGLCLPSMEAQGPCQAPGCVLVRLWAGPGDAGLGSSWALEHSARSGDAGGVFPGFRGCCHRVAPAGWSPEACSLRVLGQSLKSRCGQSRVLSQASDRCPRPCCSQPSRRRASSRAFLPVSLCPSSLFLPAHQWLGQGSL